MTGSDTKPTRVAAGRPSPQPARASDPVNGSNIVTRQNTALLSAMPADHTSRDSLSIEEVSG